MVNFLTGKYKICNQCLQFKGKNPRIVKEINTKIMSKNNDFDPPPSSNEHSSTLKRHTHSQLKKLQFSNDCTTEVTNHKH